MNTAQQCEHKSLPANCSSRFERNRHRALELFAHKGFGQVSMRELARHLDLTPGSIYSHCSGKEELLMEFIEEHYLAMLALFSRRHLRGCPMEALRRIINGLEAYHAKHPLHFQLAIRDSRSLHTEQRQYIEQLREQLRQQLESRLRAAGFNDSSQAGTPTLELFEHLPLWLANYPLNEQQRSAALVNVLTAALIPNPENRV